MFRMEHFKIMWWTTLTDIALSNSNIPALLLMLAKNVDVETHLQCNINLKWPNVGQNIIIC